MRHLQMVIGTCACAALMSCNSPEQLAPASNVEASANSDFETAELKVGKVRFRPIAVPAGYSLVDMNDGGDLLLNSAWLPNGRGRPKPLPFAGRFISNDRQILGPEASLLIYRDGHAEELPSPCTPHIEGELTWNCNEPEQTLGQGKNGDVLGAHLQFENSTPFSPIRTLEIWRATTGTWQQLVYLSHYDGPLLSGVVSDNGWVAAAYATQGWDVTPPGQVEVFTPAGTSAGGLGSGDLCSAFGDARIDPLAINDLGEVVGFVVCWSAEFLPNEFRPMKWSNTGLTPIPGLVTSADGVARAIDNYGNMAGTLKGHEVIWLADGTVIDLSLAAGSQNVSASKFLGRGHLLGSIDGKPGIWRFGF